jgi:hypothetical protein
MATLPLESGLLPAELNLLTLRKLARIDTTITVIGY